MWGADGEASGGVIVKAGEASSGAEDSAGEPGRKGARKWAPSASGLGRREEGRGGGGGVEAPATVAREGSEGEAAVAGGGSKACRDPVPGAPGRGSEEEASEGSDGAPAAEAAAGSPVLNVRSKVPAGGSTAPARLSPRHPPPPCMGPAR